MNKDVSSSAMANSSIIDGGSDIGEATTNALNRSKSNDKLSHYKTPRDDLDKNMMPFE